MEKIKMVYLERIYAEIAKDLEPKLLEFIRSGKFILGDYVKAFEDDLKARYSFNYCAGVASGTDALMIALRACGVGPGDEVIIPAFTIFVNAAIVKMVGAVPVFADVNESDFNINAESVKRIITKKTKAIVAVHLFGQCADMEEILKISAKNRIAVIEDACQAIGAKYKNIYAGNLGDIGCFSFYPTKNLGGAGDGGLMTVREEAVFSKVKLLHLHGIKSQPYIQDVWAYNSRLDAFQALFLKVKLKYLAGWEEKRRRIAAYYNGKLKNSAKLKLPLEKKDCYHVYHQYTLLVDDRKTLAAYLTANNIDLSVFYPAIIPEQPAYLQDVKNQAYKNWPVSKDVAGRVLSIPVNPQMTDSEVEYVADKLVKY